MDSLGIPKESIGIPKDSLGICRESIGGTGELLFGKHHEGLFLSRRGIAATFLSTREK